MADIKNHNDKIAMSPEGCSQYQHTEKSDIFILFGVEDFVPVLEPQGQRRSSERAVESTNYRIQSHYPRFSIYPDPIISSVGPLVKATMISATLPFTHIFLKILNILISPKFMKKIVRS